MKIKDDRTPAQKLTHIWLVVGSDPFVSGLGARAFGEGFKSFAAWACTNEDLPRVELWVKNRKDLKRVRTVLAKTYRPKGYRECRVYLADENHPVNARHYAFKAEMAAMGVKVS